MIWKVEPLSDEDMIKTIGEVIKQSSSEFLIKLEDFINSNFHQNQSEWKDAKPEPPKLAHEVIVSDGKGSYAVAWYHRNDKIWHASDDMLEASNHDGGATIIMDLGMPITHWKPLPKGPNE